MADSVKVEKVEGAWRIDLSGWKTGDVMAWQEAANRLHLPDLIRMMAGVVKAWEFEGDPTQEAAYKELSLNDTYKAALEVGKAVTQLFLAAARSIR